MSLSPCVVRAWRSVQADDDESCLAIPRNLGDLLRPIARETWICCSDAGVRPRARQCDRPCGRRPRHTRA